jgi:hypothetical protein
MTSSETTDNQPAKDWRISLERGVALVQFAGGATINAELIKSAYNHLISHPEKYRSSNAVWDFRNIVVGPTMGYREISEVVNHLQRLRPTYWQHSKSAVVVENKVSYGLCRMYGALMDGKLDFELKIFENDLDAAIAWAGESD